MKTPPEIPVTRYVGGVQVGMLKPMAVKNPSPAVYSYRRALLRWLAVSVVAAASCVAIVMSK
jgi:hypothetical protein